LPENAEIGTVDKFQGQEAPIVLISMVTSSAKHLPPALSFFITGLDKMVSEERYATNSRLNHRVLCGVLF